MNQGILVATAHSEITLPELAAKVAAFKHSKLSEHVKQSTENGEAHSEAGKQDCQNLSRAW